MSTIVRGRIPTEELALNHVLEELPDVEVECERVVKSGESAVMPLLWIRHPDREAVDAALAADPTVDTVDCLSDFGDEFLFEMKWIDHVSLLLDMVTNGEATVLDAYGRRDGWQIRVLYPDRDHLSRTHEFAEDHGQTFDVLSILEMEGEPAGRYGLTDGQYRALELASERGYYEVPKEVTLEELAEEVDVSHQALSEQLRRGTGALIEDTLLVGSPQDDEE